LCESKNLHELKRANCKNHPLYHQSLQEKILWLICKECNHIFTEGYFTDWAFKLILESINESQTVGHNAEISTNISSKMIENVLPFLSKGIWLDVGFGNGSLLITASKYGFKPIGVDLRLENVKRLRMLGIQAYQSSLDQLNLDELCSIISMADVLEHVPYPKVYLKKTFKLLKDDGILLISMPDTESISWKSLELRNINPYWSEIEHYHNFSKSRLYSLLKECGFIPINYHISKRYVASMEIIAKKLIID